MFDIKLRTKILIITLLPLIITITLLSALLIHGQVSEFNEQISAKSQAAADYLAPASEYAIISNNFAYMESTFKHTLEIDEVKSIEIFDNNNNLLLKKTKDYSTEYPPETTRVFYAPIFKSTLDIFDNYTEEDSQTVRQQLGKIKLTISLESSQLKKASIIKNGIFLTIISIMITTLIALYFSQTVSSPLSLLLTGIKSIKEGDFSQRINIPSNTDEIKELVHGINNMTSALEISRLKEKQRSADMLFIEKTKAQITLEAIGEGVITTDINGYVTYLNPTAELLTGYSLDSALNRPLPEIFKVKLPDSESFVEYPILECINNSKKLHHESNYILVSNKNIEYIIRETATPILDRDNIVVGAVVIFHDFSNIKKMSDILSYQASHDELTDLLNRRSFEHKVKELFNTNDNATHVLCYIDLDNFKIINDSYGHLAGDSLLKLVASHIDNETRKVDYLARLGGDEFAIILHNCTIEKAQEIAESLRKVISNIVFKWKNQQFAITSSIGLVPFSQNSNYTQLMMTVDSACYIAKNKGRNRVHVYHEGDDEILSYQGDILWYKTINEALKLNKFTLFVQKISSYNEPDKSIKTYEVLLRISQHKLLIQPADFLPSAIRYSLMPKIDRWVIHNLFETIKNNNCDDTFMVNLSSQTIKDLIFIDDLVDYCSNSEINPSKIIFEINEEAATNNFDEAQVFMNRLKPLGFRFSLDNYGNSIYSFSKLARLPVDYIKIDGRYIQQIPNVELNQVIVESISRIAQSLNLKLIAKHVEKQEVIDLLTAYDINYFQGDAIGRPFPILELFTPTS